MAVLFSCIHLRQYAPLESLAEMTHRPLSLAREESVSHTFRRPSRQVYDLVGAEDRKLIPACVYQCYIVAYHHDVNWRYFQSSGTRYLL
jgi:hypothetical protein